MHRYAVTLLIALFASLAGFAGFNALTPVEEYLIKYFITEYDAEILWDVDRYYLDSDTQEAGDFLRKYQNDSVFGPTFPTEIPQRITRDKTVSVTGVSLEVGQAKAIGEQVDQFGGRNADPVPGQLPAAEGALQGQPDGDELRRLILFGEEAQRVIDVAGLGVEVVRPRQVARAFLGGQLGQPRPPPVVEHENLEVVVVQPARPVECALQDVALLVVGGDQHDGLGRAGGLPPALQAVGLGGAVLGAGQDREGAQR